MTTRYWVPRETVLADDEPGPPGRDLEIVIATDHDREVGRLVTTLRWACRGFMKLRTVRRTNEIENALAWLDKEYPHDCYPECGGV